MHIKCITINTIPSTCQRKICCLLLKLQAHAPNVYYYYSLNMSKKNMLFTIKITGTCP